MAKRGRPRKTQVVGESSDHQEATAGVVDTAPSSVSEALAETGVTAGPETTTPAAPKRGRPRKAVEPEKPAGFDYAVFGPIMKQVMDPLYVGVGVASTDCPAPEVWAMFCTAWGGVVSYYFPVAPDSPWPSAILATALIAAPLYPAIQKRQMEKARRAMQPPQPARPTLVVDKPAPGDATPDMSMFLGAQKS